MFQSPWLDPSACGGLDGIGSIPCPNLKLPQPILNGLAVSEPSQIRRCDVESASLPGICFWRRFSASGGDDFKSLFLAFRREHGYLRRIGSDVSIYRTRSNRAFFKHSTIRLL